MDVVKNEEELARELTELSESVKKMASAVERVEKKRYFSIIEHPWKFVFFSFLQGIMTTLGATLGIAIVVGGILYLFKQFDIFPGLTHFLESILPGGDVNPDL